MRIGSVLLAIWLVIGGIAAGQRGDFKGPMGCSSAGTIAVTIAASGLRPLAFLEYDVEYVVCDIESLVFWLNALDTAHADIDGPSALASAAILNRILAGNVDEHGFVTNEHRYLAIAQCTRNRVTG